MYQQYTDFQYFNFISIKLFIISCLQSEMHVLDFKLIVLQAFTTNFEVHWGQHLLRPELVESTYFLYEATNDPYYLEVGKYIVENLNRYTKVPCGFAAVKDVRTLSHEDRYCMTTTITTVLQPFFPLTQRLALGFPQQFPPLPTLLRILPFQITLSLSCPSLLHKYICYIHMYSPAVA